MQSVDIEPNKEEKLEKLEQDWDKPFSPPALVEERERLPKNHPALDTGIDAHEWYDEGRAGAAEIPDTPKRVILGYIPRVIKKNSQKLRKIMKSVVPER
ncbi:hypothetical protein HYS84_03700 [Candidatus Saccharibacteria bacterium]|nr:hypothetical protein [Candidatus Saccharibacteria bacterium]